MIDLASVVACLESAFVADRPAVLMADGAVALWPKARPTEGQLAAVLGRNIEAMQLGRVTMFMAAQSLAVGLPVNKIASDIVGETVLGAVVLMPGKWPMAKE